jgi:3-dehydroquinate dehydratase type II
MRVLVLNGPNLNLLGTREPEIYGATTLEDLEAQVAEWAGRLGVETSFRQSNHEGDLVDAIQRARDLDGIIINPGALTHTSRALGDAIVGTAVPAIEVHISNVKARESWRAVSTVSDACVRTFYGRGIAGYRDALRHLVNRAAVPVEALRYGPHRENVADLRWPSGELAGLVVLVHGGFWLRQWERDGMETLAVDLAGRGFASLNLEYRRLGDGGGWPGSAHDVLTALRSIHQHSELDALSLTVVGHSAGGHLALWGANHMAAPPDLVVGLAAVTDLEALAIAGAGGSAQARTLLDDGAPGQVDALPGRTLLIHGREDDVVPISHSTRLEGPARVDLIDGMGHFAVLDPLREHWPLIVGAIEKAS